MLSGGSDVRSFEHVISEKVRSNGLPEEGQYNYRFRYFGKQINRSSYPLAMIHNRGFSETSVSLANNDLHNINYASLLLRIAECNVEPHIILRFI